jgi:hypothetical protein
MAFTGTWDETKPAGSRARSLGDDDIRDFKRDIRERLAIDHQFVNDETGDATVGYHKKVTLKTTTNPTAVADTGILFCKDVAGKAELHFIDESGAVIQITSGGALKLV